MGDLVERSLEGQVVLLQLNRPESRNALSAELMMELAAELERIDAEPELRCVVVAGSDQIFAAGADIRAMSERTYAEVLYHPAAEFWKRIARVKTPMVAAVSGYALGGGCELALACDMIVASETAKFGQPEINLGIIPGGGGSQRLARVLGKHLAMEFVLTGRHFDAETCLQMGLINRVVKSDVWLPEAMQLAQKVAAQAPIAARLAKQAVIVAEETALSAGLDSERHLYELAMASEDRVEGMLAFLEKREPQFRGH